MAFKIFITVLLVPFVLGTGLCGLFVFSMGPLDGGAVYSLLGLVPAAIGVLILRKLWRAAPATESAPEPPPLDR